MAKMLSVNSSTGEEILEDIPDPAPDLALYKALRKGEYPEIGEQLDAIWEMLTPLPGSKAEAVKRKIDGVKTKYPQPKE